MFLFQFQFYNSVRLVLGCRRRVVERLEGRITSVLSAIGMIKKMYNSLWFSLNRYINGSFLNERKIAGSQRFKSHEAIQIEMLFIKFLLIPRKSVRVRVSKHFLYGLRGTCEPLWSYQVDFLIQRNRKNKRLRSIHCASYWSRVEIGWPSFV